MMPRRHEAESASLFGWVDPGAAGAPVVTLPEPDPWAVPDELGTAPMFAGGVGATVARHAPADWPTLCDWQEQPADSDGYIRRIKHAGKRAYAEAYAAWMREGGYLPEPEPVGLSYMGAQAVRLALTGGPCGRDTAVVYHDPSGPVYPRCSRHDTVAAQRRAAVDGWTRRTQEDER